jgi:hypothetical protein
MSVLGSFLSSWEEMPSGIVGAVFPALAGILLREEDIDILIVQIPPVSLSLQFQAVPCDCLLLGLCTEWTTITQFIDFPRIS